MRAEVVGAVAEIVFRVDSGMAAVLDGCLVHPLCSTFWLAYYAEVAARRAIEPFLEPEENAVGAELWLRHEGMAPIGVELRLRAQVSQREENRVWCSIEVFSGQQRIATGRQLQVVLPHAVLRQRVEAAYAAHQLQPPSEHPNVRIVEARMSCGSNSGR